jgi:asparagine synthetase B (glutamine-hydrolysing)
MCGIFGYWDREAARPCPTRRAGRHGAASLAHRGPDDDGTWHQPQRGVAIGNRRLSIIDIGGGHQPFVSDDGQIAVVQNGEIFNYIELAADLRRQGVQLKTASDTEVILRLYEREGIAFVSKLNGMFAIAIDDAARGRAVPGARPHRRQAAVRGRRRQRMLFALGNQGHPAAVWLTGKGSRRQDAWTWRLSTTT